MPLCEHRLRQYDPARFAGNEGGKDAARRAKRGDCRLSQARKRSDGILDGLGLSHLRDVELPDHRAMAAIFGSAFPDVVKTVLVDRIVALSTGKPLEPAAPAADAQGFREVMPAATPEGGAAPAWGAQAATASWQSQPATAPPAVVPVGGPPPGEGMHPAAGFAAQAGGPAPPHMPPVSPAAYPRPSDAGLSNAAIAAASLQPGACGPDRTACPLEQPDRFTEIERKLREYGATYYLLETYGGQGDLYRFHCRMAVAGGQYPQMFEATDRDALKAMADVLHRVETWRGGQLQ
jgi:hypothetical protein